MLPDLIKETQHRKMKAKLNRKGTEIRFLKFGGWLNFYDLFKLTTEGSLMKLAKLLNLAKKTRTGLQKDLTVPYAYFNSMEKLFGRDVPPLDDPSWLSLKDGERMIGEQEHAEISKEVGDSSWYDVFSTYLKKVVGKNISRRASILLTLPLSQQDCVLVLASLLEMDSLYANEFGVDLLSCRYTSAGAVITSHLDAMINKAGVQGFSQIRNATIAKLLLRSRLGGIVESRVRKSGRLVEASDEGAQAERVIGLDLNQLYPSMQYLYNNMLGEMTLYSDASGSGVLEATSNLNPYSEEYKALAVYRDMLEADGNIVLSIYSNHSNERKPLLPRYYPDAMFVSTKEGEDGVTLTMFQYDGW